LPKTIQHDIEASGLIASFFTYIKGDRQMAKKKTDSVYQECDNESLRWMGKYTNCNHDNTFVEEVKQPKEQRGIGAAVSSKTAKPMKINQIVSEKEPRVTTSMREFNRVLGGGVVPGLLVLIGGDPGIGKSTLLLQISAQIADKD